MELTVTNRSQAYPNAEKEISKQSVGLKKSKKDLQKLIGCSIILYVVLKARSHTIFDRCASPGEIGWLYMLSTVFLDSSMVEHSAVNRRVVGSSPTRGVLFWEIRLDNKIWLLGQVVKTPASHAGYRGSNPLGVTKWFDIQKCIDFWIGITYTLSLPESSRIAHAIPLLFILFILCTF